MSLERDIEGVLFYKAEPMKKTVLAAFFEVSEDDLLAALAELENRLLTGATRLAVTDTTVQLVLAPELDASIEKLRKDELRRDIGKAGSETLAIVLYRGPISRIEIDRIRGVNSNFILRNLLMRGLVERRDNPRDQRSFLYAITPALLNHLGISKREDLPQFSDIMNQLDQFERDQDAIEKEENSLT